MDLPALTEADLHAALPAEMRAAVRLGVRNEYALVVRVGKTKGRKRDKRAALWLAQRSVTSHGPLAYKLARLLERFAPTTEPLAWLAAQYLMLPVLRVPALTRCSAVVLDEKGRPILAPKPHLPWYSEGTPISEAQAHHWVAVGCDWPFKLIDSRGRTKTVGRHVYETIVNR